MQFYSCASFSILIRYVYVAKLLILFDKCTSLPPLALKYQYVDVKYARQIYAFVLIPYKYSFNTLPICALRNKVSAFSLICLTRSLLKLSFSPISSRLSSGVFIPKYIRMTCDSLSGNKSSAWCTSSLSESEISDESALPLSSFVACLDVSDWNHYSK